MNILLTASTANELGSFAHSSQQPGELQELPLDPRHRLHGLVTGVGVAATTFNLTRAANNIDLIISIGIAGSYNQNLYPTSVVYVESERFADYGIDDNGQFRTLQQAGLTDAEETLQNRFMCNNLSISKLARAKGITVSTASGSQGTIDRNVALWHPDIETMENAATFFVANALNIKLISLRAISNMVEPRNKKNWQMQQAIDKLQQITAQLITEIFETV